MKLFLLTAGSSYYPLAGQGNWHGTYSTHAEALAAVTPVEFKRKITQGARAGEEEVVWRRYLIGATEHDWFEIINLSNWIFELDPSSPIPTWGPFTT